MNLDLLDRLLAFEEVIEVHEIAIKELKAAKDDLEQQIVREFIDAETQSIDRKGRQFYLSRTLCVNVPSGKREQLYEALRANGHGDLVQDNVNHQRLAALVREIEAANRTPVTQGNEWLPEALRDVVSVFEKVSIRNRSS